MRVKPADHILCDVGQLDPLKALLLVWCDRVLIKAVLIPILRHNTPRRPTIATRGRVALSEQDVLAAALNRPAV